MAVIFATRLRQAGLRVWLVGLHGRMSFGRDGIGLTVDLSVSQALARVQRATSVIVPGHSPQIGLLDNDPRIGQLLELADRNSATFVAGNAPLEELEVFPIPTHRLLLCRTAEGCTERADELIQTLLTKKPI